MCRGRRSRGAPRQARRNTAVDVDAGLSLASPHRPPVEYLPTHGRRTTMPLLRQRVRSLTHRAATLPLEVDAWISQAVKGAAFEKNLSQLDALNHFMGKLRKRLHEDVQRLES